MATGEIITEKNIFKAREKIPSLKFKKWNYFIVNEVK
jgi:hypothetical protein